MTEVVVYSKEGCTYCVRAKMWLDNNNVPYTVKDLSDTSVRDELFSNHPEVKTVPQIFVDGVRVGGYTDLIGSDFAKKIKSGEL